MRTKLPELWTRTRKNVLYGFVLSPSDFTRILSQMFTDCMVQSAVVGGLLALVTGGNFATAVAAFKFSIESCLRYKIVDTMKECIISDLIIRTD